MDRLEGRRMKKERGGGEGGKDNGGKWEDGGVETERGKETVGYNLRINSWVALAEFNKDGTVVDDDLRWVWQLQDIAKENFSDDVLHWNLGPLKGALGKQCQGGGTESKHREEKNKLWNLDMKHVCDL